MPERRDMRPYSRRERFGRREEQIRQPRPERRPYEQEEEPGELLIWGRNAVLESLRGWRKPVRIWMGEGVHTGGAIGEILQAAGRQGIPVTRISHRDLDMRVGDVNHQGVIAEVPPFEYADLEDALALARQRNEMPLLLLLDSVQDPQNLGTLIRTAAAVGVHGIVIPRHRAAPVTGAVVKSSAGAIEHVPVIQVTNLSQTIERLKKESVWIAGLDMDAKQAYDEVDLKIPLALVVGSEGKGMSQIVTQHCDFLLKLPMHGQMESLNAAVAGSIALYEAWRQRTRPTSRSDRE